MHYCTIASSFLHIANMCIIAYGSLMDRSRREILDFIKFITTKLDISISALAKEVGISHTTLTRAPKENTKHSVSIPTLNKLANAGGYQSFTVGIEAMKRAPVNVRHYVGGGQEVLLLDNESVLEEVDPPQGYYSQGIIAAIVRGQSMEPMLEDNWLIFYEAERVGVLSDCLSKLCVVQLHNEGLLVKHIKLGSKDGLFHLISKNPAYQPLFDQKVVWAAPVIDIRPR